MEEARPASTQLSERERELLDATLEVLHECGYDRLTIDAVVGRARASKTTVYRRWPSKADLVVAAFAHGIRRVAVVPDTGSLREDLMSLGRILLDQLRDNAGTIVGVLPEVRRSGRLRATLEHEFLTERRALIYAILGRAAERGEIPRAAINHELWDLLPGYLIFRAILPGRPPDETTLQQLVDEILIPTLTMHR